MLEKDLERKLRYAVETGLQGRCMKWVSPGNRGVPDRIVLLPGGRVAFVEMKRPGGRTDPLQEYWHNQLRSLGYPVYVIYTPEDLSRVLQALKHQQPLAEIELAQTRKALQETAAELRYWRGECSRLAAKE